MRAFHYFSKDVITHTLAKGKGMEEKTEKGKLLSELFFACFGGDTGNTFLCLQNGTLKNWEETST